MLKSVTIEETRLGISGKGQSRGLVMHHLSMLANSHRLNDEFWRDLTDQESAEDI
jgi:hypothetical protein